MTSEEEASSSESEQGEEMVMKNMESSDEDSSKEMETVGAVEVELEEKVCIDGEGNGLKDGGSGDSEDDSSSNGEEHVTWQAALTGDLDADSAESDDYDDDNDDDWKPDVKKGAKTTKVKEKLKSKRKVDGINVKKPISQTLVDLMDMDENNHDDDDDDDSGSDEDWAPESSKGRKKGLSDRETDFKTEQVDSQLRTTTFASSR